MVNYIHFLIFFSFSFIVFSECMGIYGGGRRIITELGANEMPYGLALRHNNVYWTDWKKYVINLLTNLLLEKKY